MYIMRKTAGDITFQTLRHCCIHSAQAHPDKAVEKEKAVTKGPTTGQAGQADPHKGQEEGRRRV